MQRLFEALFTDELHVLAWLLAIAAGALVALTLLVGAVAFDVI